MSINTPRQYMVRRGLPARPGGFRATMKTWMMEGSIGSDQFKKLSCPIKSGIPFLADTPEPNLLSSEGQ